MLKHHLKASSIQNRFITSENYLKPWKFTNISESKFKQKADTGNILLYKGNSFGSKVIRTATNGKFDHVAMLLKFESDFDEIYIIEATTNLGVHLNKWSFIRDHVGKKKFYQQIMFRKIEYNRSDRVVEQLEIFLKEAIGQSYGIGSKILSGKKSIKLAPSVSTDENQRQLIEEERTFFCSELVAKAFKVLGIIEDDETASSSFLPGHFSHLNDKLVKYTKGTKLEDEVQILIQQENVDT